MCYKTYILYAVSNSVLKLKSCKFQLWMTACLSGAAKFAQRQRDEKKFHQRERGRKLKHRATRSQRGEGALVVFAHFFLLFLYNTYVH